MSCHTGSDLCYLPGCLSALSRSCLLNEQFRNFNAVVSSLVLPHKNTAASSYLHAQTVGMKEPRLALEPLQNGTHKTQFANNERTNAAVGVFIVLRETFLWVSVSWDLVGWNQIYSLSNKWEKEIKMFIMRTNPANRPELIKVCV